MVQDVENLLKDCYEYKNSLHKNDKQELKYLIREIEHCFPQISAAGFFSVNSQTFLSLFASFATYFLAFIEFDKVYMGKNKNESINLLNS